MVWACAAKRWWWFGDEMRGVWSRGSKTKRKTKKDLERCCQARKLNIEDAMDHSKWRKVIKDVRWSGWMWVGECFFWYRPTRVVPDQRPLNGCVCVCVFSWPYIAKICVFCFAVRSSACNIKRVNKVSLWTYSWSQLSSSTCLISRGFQFVVNFSEQQIKFYGTEIVQATRLRRPSASSPQSECAGWCQQGRVSSKTLFQQNFPILTSNTY